MNSGFHKRAFGQYDTCENEVRIMHKFMIKRYVLVVFNIPPSYTF